MIAESPDFEFDRNEVLSKLPLCGSCRNLKMLAWEKGADMKAGIGRMAVRPLGVQKAYVVVNCGWLKIQMADPQRLRVCDGWQDK